ncbi:type II secretion system protein N [Dyella sp. ASV21]|uniref:type II secretion system protein N n=1 Tax=Dyella sp. ASV21 TaxID=2795114 RepID=UPI0018EB4239|nr:type II secretion system protein N [Dyella sp. ASV21]
MKHWRIALGGVSALLAIGLAVVCFLPARWAMPWLAPRLNGLRLQEVSGSLWDGQAAQVLSSRGENLGHLHWQLSRSALWGDPQLELNLQGPRVDFAGRMRGRSSADARWTDVQMRADLALFGNGLALPMGQPLGVVQLVANDVQLHGGWPLNLDAHLTWQDAALRAPHRGELTLGNLQMQLRAGNGVIEGHLLDDGTGPLRIDGQLQLSPLARRFTAQAQARAPDSQVQRWLQSLGSTDAQGITHINYSGGLAAALPGGTR